MLDEPLLSTRTERFTPGGLRSGSFSKALKWYHFAESPFYGRHPDHELTALYPSLEVRDTVLKTGMERGAAISYDRLEEVVARLKGRS